ncbi:MAG: hypothetical protein IJY99_00950 [Alphaproteobacteria bacterium]|nr:hypothetical protein [Alphaproteobacteria bacterium]
MKVKNIAFSGFAAAILGGVCGATDANAIQLVSPEYVSKQLEAKQDVLKEGSNITIAEDNTISASFDTTGLATKEEVQQVEGLIPTDYVTENDLAGYATTGDLQTVEGKIPTDTVTSQQLQTVEQKIPATVAELTDAADYALKTEVQDVAGDVAALQGTVGDAELATTAKTITAAINELKGKTDGMATTGNFTEMNNKISDLEQLVGTESVESQIQSATSDLATKDELQTVEQKIPTATSQLTNDSKYISGTGAAGNYIVHLDGAGNVTWKAVEVIGADGNDMLAE